MFKKIPIIVLSVFLLLATFAFGAYCVVRNQDIYITDDYIVSDFLGFCTIYNIDSVDNTNIVEIIDEEEGTSVYLIPNSEN